MKCVNFKCKKCPITLFLILLMCTESVHYIPPMFTTLYQLLYYFYQLLPLGTNFYYLSAISTSFYTTSTNQVLIQKKSTHRL